MSFQPTKTWEERFFSRKAASVALEKGFKETDADPKELAMGIAVELEHTDDVEKSKATALDHLAEMPDYYTKLKKMEKEGVSLDRSPDVLVRNYKYWKDEFQAEQAKEKPDPELIKTLEHRIHEAWLELTKAMEKEGVVRKKDGEYCAYSEKGKNFGCYPSKEKAKKRVQQMEMFKHIKKGTMEKDEAVSFGPPTKVKQEVMVSREDDSRVGQTGIVQTIDLKTHDVTVLFPGSNMPVPYKIEDLVTWDAPMEEDVLPIHHPGWKGGDRTGRHWETLHVHACFRKEASRTPYETKPSVGDSTFAASPDELVPSSDGQRQEAPNESDSNSRVSEMEKAIDLEIKKVKDKKRRRTAACPKCMCHAAAIQGNHAEAMAWASEIPGEATPEAKLQRVLENCPRARRAMFKQAEIVTWKTNPYGTESGTCAACAALDGEVIDTDNPFAPRVPLHPHCACEEE